MPSAVLEVHVESRVLTVISADEEWMKTYQRSWLRARWLNRARLRAPRALVRLEVAQLIALGNNIQVRIKRNQRYEL